MHRPLDRRLPANAIMPLTIALLCGLAACGGASDIAASPLETVVPADTAAAAAVSAVRDASVVLAQASLSPRAMPAATAKAAQVPVVLNTSRAARAGDIVAVHGTNFGPSPTVWLDAAGATPSTPLQVLHRFGGGWLAVRIPADATGALVLRVSNGEATSVAVPLNAATPFHTDALQITPGGRLRIVGRNLRWPGSTPVVSIDGQSAAVDLAASSEHVLQVSAPVGLRAGSMVGLSVDNGNGTGPVAHDRNLNVVAGSATEPYGLQVGWAAAFAPLATQVIDASKDTRLTRRVACDGRTNDGPAIQAALVYVQRQGGGTVMLPAGRCYLASGVQMLSRTALQGAGAELTELVHDIDSPLYADRADLVAVRQLTLSNIGQGAGASLNLKNSTRLVVQGLRVNEGPKAMAWLHGNTHLVVADSEFIQTGSLDAPGAVNVVDAAGLVFVNNRVRFLNNIGTNLDRVHDAVVQGNTWTRDAVRQSDPGVVHTLTVNFAARLALLGNRFETVNGPVDQLRNDNETILTEGGGARRTEGLGMVASATANSFTDPAGRIPPNALINGSLPENYGVTIVSGTGAGQTRRITAANAGTFTIDRAWDVMPDTTSRYASAVWGLERAIIRGNSFTQSPRGIWLYSTAVRDVDLLDNTFTENGGILVRSFQDATSGWMSPIVGVRVAGNTIINSTRRFPSYLSVHFANKDGEALGLSHVGVEIRNNRVIANSPNVNATPYMGAAGLEGYMNQMTIESRTYSITETPRLLGTIFQGNTCRQCATAFRLSTGATATVLADNVLELSGTLWTDARAAANLLPSVATWVP